MIIYTTPANQVLEPVEKSGRDHFICVFLSPVVTEDVQNFRCLSCGWMVAQFSNKSVDAIVYGVARPKDKNSVDLMCGRCHTIFRIV